MAREKDAEKRASILAEAKRLFAERGYHATSIADIVSGIDMPVGSVYTYFKTKDDIIKTIIDEGWAAYREAMVPVLAAESGGKRKLALIVNRFLPALFADVDLISILLSEGADYSNLGEKLSSLAGVIGAAMEEERSAEVGRHSDEREMLAGIMVFFLGSMDSVRILRAASMPVSEADILRFIRGIISRAYGIDIESPDS